MTQDQELELLTPPPTAAPSLGHVGLPAPTLLYSADGRYVFQRQSHVVRVLHAQSGRVLQECVRNGSKNAVTSLALHPHNALQLLAAYEDGYIVCWDFEEHKSLLELETSKKVLWMGSSRTNPSLLLLVVQDDDNWSVVEFSLSKKKLGRELYKNSKDPFQAAAMQSYQFSQDSGAGDYFVAIGGKCVTSIWMNQLTDEDHKGRVFTKVKRPHSRNLTCVALSPTNREFAIGDTYGQIHRFLKDGQVEPSDAMMHWHSHAVHCVQYSSNGQFLMSGGEECVLISWQLETGRRAYLPRLPASVEVIAPRLDGGVYAVSLADNSLFQYNPVTREQEWEARGLARAGASAASTVPSRQLTTDPVSRALVLNGSSGAGVLQFYEPFADRVLQTLLLSERNQVTRTEKEILPMLIASHSRFSARGDDLVTLYAPSNAQVGEAQSLRFYSRRVDGSFFVNTAVDAPHGRALVTAVVFSPNPNHGCVVTADRLGDFKVWEKTTLAAGGTAWNCQAVVRFRDEPVTAVSFARDGSLLAVAYGNKLTLWDIDTHSLRRVIPSADGQKIRQIVFVGANSPFVVLVTENQVQVWNLLTLSLWWRYAVPDGVGVAEETSLERFLVWMPVDEDSNKTLVLVFDPQTPVPKCVRVVDLRSKLWSAGFHPGTGDIVLLDKNTGVWRLDGPDARSPEARRRKVAHVAAVAERDAAKDGEHEAKALSAIYNAARAGRVAGKKASETKHVGPSAVATNGSASSSLFDAPAHVLPSMTALYRSFMDTMLPKSHQGVAANGNPTSNGAKRAASNAKQSKNKRRKQQQQQKQQNVEEPSVTDNVEQQKRMNLQVEKELANTVLQQQTYSKLLETFRKKRTQKA